MDANIINIWRTDSTFKLVNHPTRPLVSCRKFKIKNIKILLYAFYTWLRDYIFVECFSYSVLPEMSRRHYFVCHKKSFERNRNTYMTEKTKHHWISFFLFTVHLCLCLCHSLSLSHSLSIYVKSYTDNWCICYIY